MATRYTTLKLTDDQVQALFHIMGVAYDGITDNMETDAELGMTLWGNTYKAIDEITDKLTRSGWVDAE
jgi:hypothetical protein